MLWKLWKWATKAGSAEWLLKKRANGGDVILARALVVSLLTCSIALFLKFAFDPRNFAFGGYKHYVDCVDTLPWFGATFAAVYAALYARFSSQWSYLAGLYNQIKQTEAQLRPEDRWGNWVLAQWKAGFIEDAEVLHLATKRVFASVIETWARSEHVRRAYVQTVPGGEKKLTELLHRIRAAKRDATQRAGGKRGVVRHVPQAQPGE